SRRRMGWPRYLLSDRPGGLSGARAEASNAGSRGWAVRLHIGRARNPSAAPLPVHEVRGRIPWTSGGLFGPADARPLRGVDGGLNPRISGGGPKVGTNFAVDLLAGRMRDDRPLSTPQAAGGGGQRPAFTGVYRPARIVNRDRCVAALGMLL